MSDDGFILVKKSKRNRRFIKTGQSADKNSIVKQIECCFSKEDAIRKILLAREEVTASDFYSFLLKTLSKGLKELGNPEVKEIICYGLGHFAECIGSRFQFGLLLSLKDRLSVDVSVFDPIFNKTEIDILEELGCSLIPVNEEGKRKTKPDVVTLIYLPHCPKQLTNNFLWSNWGPQLRNCIIFSNSFSKIIESHPSRILYSSAEYILNISPYTQEFGIDNCFKYNDIFNDSAIHIFPQNKLDSVTKIFWESRKEPEYSEDTSEFIFKRNTEVEFFLSKHASDRSNSNFTSANFRDQTY